MTATALADTRVAGAGAADQLSLFAVLWAVAALFHVWVNTRGFGFVEDPSLTGLTHIVLVALALVVLAAPDRLWPLVALCATVVVSAWCEAPFIGNHWILAALVSIGLLLAAASAPGGRDVVARRFLPVARGTTLVFYAFAAFAKLNSGFFDPDTSCALFFLDESAASWSFDAVRLTGSDVLGRVVIFATALTELSIPVLLLVRRTRLAGVLLAIAFHFLIALDRTHLFGDFTSGLDAIFVLFLPASFATWALGLVRRVPVLARAAVGGAAVLVTAAMVARPSERSFDLFDTGRKVAWFAAGTAIVVAVVVWVLRYRDDRDAGPMITTAPRWLLVVPAVALLNGLTPYLELKTGFGWNMYANIVTAGGDTNHYVVPATLDVLDEQDDLVTIRASNDPSLQVYADQHWQLAWLALRSYLSDHPGSSVTYERAGARYELARADEDPALVADVPMWRDKLQVYRAVDAGDPPRCQATFLPAR